MKLDDGRLSFVAQQEVTALDAIHKAVLGKAACAGRVTEDVGACISIHAPTWGATGGEKESSKLEKFQSTHPRGVRRLTKSCAIGVTGISIHAPTWGATHGDRARLGRSLDFNPRTHVGCDPTGSWATAWRIYFNPRTHVGCDRARVHARERLRISIHAPTWGATRKALIIARLMLEFQSTHPRGVRR